MCLLVGLRSCEDQGRVHSSEVPWVASANLSATSAITTADIQVCQGQGQPHAAREAARNKICTLETVLEVSDSIGPSVDAVKSELEKARNAAKAPPLKVQITSTQDFIRRSERRVAELEAEGTAESKLLEEARERLRQGSETGTLAGEPSVSEPLGNRPTWARKTVVG